MSKKHLLFCGLVFFLLFSQLNSNNSQAEEYLNTVIDKINKMEKDLQKLQQESTNNENSLSSVSPTNTIASHEKRLIDLEDDLRNINGRIDEVLFELKNLASEFNSLKTKGNLINDDNEEKKLVTIEKENKTQVTTSQVYHSSLRG